MTLLDLQTILSAVVAGIPSAEQAGRRANTFVCLTGRSDLEAENFNKTAQSVRGGTMFVRGYNAANDQPESLRAEYPVVALEALDGSGTVDMTRWSVNLICLDQLQNTAVLDSTGRSAEEIESDTEYILTNVLRRAEQYQKFDIGGGVTLWGIASEVLADYPTAIGLEYASGTINQSMILSRFRPTGTKDGTVGTGIRFTSLFSVDCASWD